MDPSGEKPPPTMPTWADLPGDLWAKVFGALEFTERHRSAALVCRHWAELVHSPPLLADVQLQLEKAQQETTLPCIQAFCAWLLRRGARHVRRLCFCIGPRVGEHDVFAANAAAAAAGSAAVGLAGLSLFTPHPDGHALRLSWLAALTSLTHLTLEVDCGLVDICGSLKHLTSLRELNLGVWAVQWAEDARLPPSLTCLLLDVAARSVSHGMRQLSSLTRLQRLSLVNAEVESEELGFLASMPSVTYLRMESCDAPPQGLGGMTWLRHLELANTPDCHYRAVEWDMLAVWAAQLEAELAPLTHLTFLELSDLDYYCPRWPDAVAGLAELHTLVSQTLDKALLPPGPYLDSLRRVVLPMEGAAANVRVLTRAAQLATLELTTWCWPADQLALEAAQPFLVVLWWAGRYPSLRQLRLPLRGEPMLSYLLDAVEAAQRANPALQIITD